MYILIILFAAGYDGTGAADPGRAGPAAISIPGLNSSQCAAAAASLKKQIADTTLKKKTFTFCITTSP